MPIRVFRLLLRLLPEELRAGYQHEIETTLGSAHRAVTRRGSRLALVWLWLATVVDVLRVAPREHLDILARDTRATLRAWIAHPAHTITAILTLAIGIGANVAMFAVVDGVLLAPLPYRDPDRLVLVGETEAGDEPGPMGYLTFADLRDQSRSFAALVAISSSTATLTGGPNDAERVSAMRVSRAYFDMLGVAPALGRTFSEQEDRPGAARRVAILSDGLWRRRFQADTAIAGRTIAVGGLPFQVVGVMPRRFDDQIAARLYDDAEIWFPLGYDPAASFACRTCRHLRVVGRLAPGVEPGAAAQELDRLFAGLAAAHAADYDKPGAQVTRVADVLFGPVRRVLLVLWAGVVALLIVACGHVANLLLLRASERTHEMAVRTALGVTRGRLVRQLLTESGLLAAAGGLTGLVPAWMALRLVATNGPSELPRLASVGLDARVVAMTLAITTLCAVAFGLAPLRVLLRRDAAPAMRGSGRRTDSGATWRVRATLVGINVALAALLLIGAGLLVRSMSRLLAVPSGIDPSGVVTMQIWATGDAFRAGETAQQIATAARFYETVITRVRALPGVTAASAVTTLPLGGGRDGIGLHIDGRIEPNPEAAPDADRFAVLPDYFAVTRTPLLRGRLLGPGDRQHTQRVAVVNRTLAAELFPGTDPIGQRLRLGPPTAEPRTIVGVVGDVRHHGLDAPVGYQVYVPHVQWAWADTFMTLVIRAPGVPAAVAGSVRDIVRAIDAAQPVTNVERYSTIVDRTTGTRRFAMTMLLAFAGTAALLAVVGLAGALGVVVRQRQREIGVRLALGASPRAIAALVARQGLGPALAGLAAGLALAALSATALDTLLYGVRALDPITFAGALALLLSCLSIACLVPAVRAARIDPGATLRGE